MQILHNNLHYLLQIQLVSVVKCIKISTVYIQYSHHDAILEERYYNFTIRSRRTSNMPCELMHIRHNDCLRFLPCRPANATAKRDAHTGNRSLERTKNQFIAINTVQTGPPETDCVMQYRRYICHSGYKIRLAGNKRFYLRQKRLIYILFRHRYILDID